ncbi:unnamed protein product [Discosporangium mesarthrocarpum]
MYVWFVQIVRVIDSLQLGANKSLATPANWTVGDECILYPSVSAEDAAAKFPEHKTVDLPSGKPYLRTTPINEL